VRRRLLIPAVVLVTGALALVAGCGGSSGPNTSVAKGDTTTAFPGASGGYGDKPTLTFPSGNPTDKLRSKVLVQGSGPTITKGELIAFDYLGQVWHGKVFDNSYDRHEPLVSQIGAKQLIPAWDQTLVGMKVGTRVLMLVPPAYGYGSQGAPQAGISGTDTLVFVIDLIAAYGKADASDPHATPAGTPPPGITVSGALGQPVTVKVAKGTKPPKKQQLIVLDKGSGPKVHKGTSSAGALVVQYAACDWTGKALASTWKVGHPTAIGVKDPQQPSPFDALAGLPIGSRVLLLIPPTSGGNPKKQSDAVVVDLVAQPGPAKST
jgi:FKBP-type peptidyl-prolyl isomerase-like protein